MLISRSVMIIMKIIKYLVSVINLINQGGSRSNMVANIMTMFTKYENHSETSWHNDLLHTLHRELSQYRWTHNLGPEMEVWKDFSPKTKIWPETKLSSLQSRVCAGGDVVLDVDCEVRFARPVEEMEHDDAARRRWRRMDFIENR